MINVLCTNEVEEVFPWGKFPCSVSISRAIVPIVKFSFWLRFHNTWWRHQMETFSVLLAICAGNSPVTGEFPSQRPVTRMFSLICAWINDWVNNHETGDLRHHGAHYDIIVMRISSTVNSPIPITQWVNYVPPYVRKLHFMYEAIRTSGKYRWNIYRTSSKCRWSIYRTSTKRRGTLRIVHKVERSSPTVN